MTLDYPSAAAVAEAIRLRMRAQPGVPFLIVEGSSDRSLLARVLHRDVVVMSASNREKVLGSRAYLSDAQLERSIFMVDCDGLSIPGDFNPGHLVVTDYRDIDSDAALALGGLERLLAEHLSQVFDSGTGLALAVSSVKTFCVDVTTLSGIVTDAARDEGVPCRITINDAAGRPRRRRRIRADDLPSFEAWATALSVPSREADVLDDIATVMEWSEFQKASVLLNVTAGAEKLCRAHAARACPTCRPRRFVNGHDLLAGLSRLLELNYGIEVGERSLERENRLGVDHLALNPWLIVRRLRSYTANSRFPYIAEGFGSV